MCPWWVIAKQVKPLHSSKADGIAVLPRIEGTCHQSFEGYSSSHSSQSALCSRQGHLLVLVVWHLYCTVALMPACLVMSFPRTRRWHAILLCRVARLPLKTARGLQADASSSAAVVSSSIVGSHHARRVGRVCHGRTARAPKSSPAESCAPMLIARHSAEEGRMVLSTISAFAKRRLALRTGREQTVVCDIPLRELHCRFLSKAPPSFQGWPGVFSKIQSRM